MPNSEYSSLTEDFSLNDLLKALGILMEKIQYLLSKLSLSDDDARKVALFGIQEVLIGLGLTVHAITGNGLKSSQRTSAEVIESFQNWYKIENKNDQQLIDMAAKNWRLSLVTLCHFKIDSLFQNLLKALDKNSRGKSFGVNKSILMGKITLPDPKNANEVLEAFTHIRNSLHNNGIHRHKNWGPTKLLGFTYEFEKDKAVCCASFGHILAALDRSIDIIEQILFTPQIQTLPKVDDLYVQLNP